MLPYFDKARNKYSSERVKYFPLVKYICHNELPETDKEQETPVDHYWKSDIKN